MVIRSFFNNVLITLLEFIPLKLSISTFDIGCLYEIIARASSAELDRDNFFVTLLIFDIYYMIHT